MKRTIRHLNNLFILIVLFIFYFVGIGIAFLIYKILNKERVDVGSYWKGVDDKVLNPDYFKSPY